MDTLSPLESIFLNIEDGVTHMHLGSCAIFDGPAPSFDEIAALIASKLALAPRLRQRLQSVPFALGHPVWIDDVEFDLRNHLHAAALPSPGRDTELTDFVGRVMSSELNRHRPLWEIWLLEGVVDHSSNRPKWALVGKAHHAMVDGIAGADLLARLLDAESDAKLQPTDRWVPRRAPTAAALAAQAVRNAVVAPAQRAIDMTKRDTKRGVSTYSFASQLSRLGFGLSSFAAALRPSAPLSIVGNIGAERRWAVARCQLDDVKQIRKVLGGSVNDVLLTAIAGAFRTILLARGDVIDETTIVRSLIPVSLRLFDDGRRTISCRSSSSNFPLASMTSLGATKRRAGRCQT